MPFYPDTTTFATVMTDLFGRVLARPELARQLQDSKSVLRITVTDPLYTIVVDARSNPVRFLSGDDGEGKVDTGIRLPADILHAIWLGDMRLRDAYAGGKVKMEGNPITALPRLMRFANLFRYAERLYPGVLRERGMLR
jgi:putative sterol carrier protein